MRQEYLRTHSLKKRTANTTASIKSLEKQFETIREQQYAVENEEFALGLSCVGVPIDGGLSPYAIGVSAPTERFSANFDFYPKTLKTLRSEEHTSELQSLMRISYAVFCLNTKK